MVHGKVKPREGTLQRFNRFQPLTSRDKGETTGLKFTFMHMFSNKESEGCIERSNRNYQPQVISRRSNLLPVYHPITSWMNH